MSEQTFPKITLKDEMSTRICITIKPNNFNQLSEYLKDLEVRVGLAIAQCRKELTEKIEKAGLDPSDFDVHWEFIVPRGWGSNKLEIFKVIAEARLKKEVKK